jgi:hypothetical protein
MSRWKISRQRNSWRAIQIVLVGEKTARRVHVGPNRKTIHEF